MNTPKGFIDDSIIELTKDEELMSKLSECTSPEGCYELVQDKVSVNLEDFTEMMKIAKSFFEESQEGILSEDDLDLIAGGKGEGASAGTIAGFVIGSTGAAVGAGVAIYSAVSAAAGIAA